MKSIQTEEYNSEAKVIKYDFVKASITDFYEDVPTEIRYRVNVYLPLML